MRKKAAPEELMTAWQRKGVLNLGVSIIPSIRGTAAFRPPRGADLKYLRESIPRFHGLGRPLRHRRIKA